MIRTNQLGTWHAAVASMNLTAGDDTSITYMIIVHLLLVGCVTMAKHHRHFFTIGCQTVVLKLTTDRHKASQCLSTTAGILVSFTPAFAAAVNLDSFEYAR